MFILHVLVVIQRQTDLHDGIVLGQVASLGAAPTAAGGENLRPLSWLPSRFVFLISVLALPGPEAGAGAGADLGDPGAGVDLHPLHVRMSEGSPLLRPGLSPGEAGRG